jgi:hypothetical protein
MRSDDKLPGGLAAAGTAEAAPENIVQGLFERSLTLMGQLFEPGRHIRIKCYRGTHEGIMMSDCYAVKMLQSAKISEFLTYSRIRRFMKV